MPSKIEEFRQKKFSPAIAQKLMNDLNYEHDLLERAKPQSPQWKNYGLRPNRAL